MGLGCGNPEDKLNFSELKLAPALTEAIEKLGFTQLTPIQEQSIPVLISGQDLAGLSQTGTGKTAAFLIPLIERILRGQEVDNQDGPDAAEKAEMKKTRGFPDWKPFQFVLVLEPTRELAEQSYDNFIKLTTNTGLKAAILFGGVSYDKQKEILAQHPQFIFATPGRLIDLYKDHHVDLKQVRAVVFDEADRLFDMGFREDMQFVLQRIPKDRQMILFSATLNLEVMNVAYQAGSHPVEINVSRDQSKAENVKDQLFHVGHFDKPQHLLSLLKAYSQNAKQVIIFTNFKNQVNQLTQFLVENGYPAVGISSLLTQAQRLSVMTKFKSDSEHNFLVATDVAARGLDIKGVDLVINYDLPQDPETYVHRIGRTGRAGREGVALSMVSDRDVESLSRIEDITKKKIDTGYLEDEHLIKEFTQMSRERDPVFRGARGAKDLSPWNNRGGGRDGGGRGGRGNDRGGGGGDRGPRRDHRAGGGGQGGGTGQGGGDRFDGRRPQRGPSSNQSAGSSANGQHDPRRSGGAQGARADQNSARPQNGQARTQRPETRRPLNMDQNRNRSKPQFQPRRGKGAPAVVKKVGITQSVKNFFGRLFSK